MDNIGIRVFLITIKRSVIGQFKFPVLFRGGELLLDFGSLGFIGYV
jgi:hypothetical protein